MPMQPGDVIELGAHRLMCGDSTDSEAVAALMGDEKAVVLHADPPYGMGKKGVTNDNLYRRKLDAFQMQWWQTCRPHLQDNASAYIWGRAEDLWRLWLSHFDQSEPLTMRNHITWYKGASWEKNPHGNGMGSEQARMYAAMSEHCLFFMLGEQGFNTNADNYWKGFEPIRAYLDSERQRMKWDIPAVKRIVGHSDLAGDHWFSRSQWNMPTRKVYAALQQAAQGAAFQREYDDLKREYDRLRADWYATRAYFDNTHDLMTDVWRYPSVNGAERWGHPTPKPVAMMERICTTSAPPGGLVFDPFGGSGSTLIAAERTGRRAYLMECEPAYCDTIIRRYHALREQPRLIA